MVIQCPVCLGRGKDVRQEFCERCDGHGDVELPPEYDPCTPCASCVGRAKIIQTGRLCERCNGYGRKLKAGARTAKPKVDFETIEAILRYVQTRAGRKLDEVAAAYLAESFKAMDCDLPLSSAITLGAAAERMIVKTAEHIRDDATDATVHKAFSDCRDKVRALADFVINQVPRLKKDHPAEKQAFIDLEDRIETFYSFYRITRNEAGHPRDTIRAPHPNTLRAHLQTFHEFAIAILCVWTALGR